MQGSLGISLGRSESGACTFIWNDRSVFTRKDAGNSDGISMGTDGMRYSLQSRDLIADQVESAAGGHWLDGMVVVPGCDKNMPGVLMACGFWHQYMLFSTCLIVFVCSGAAQQTWLDGLRRYNTTWFMRGRTATRPRLRIPIVWKVLARWQDGGG